MFISPLLVFAVTSAAPDLERAQALYDDARYEKALNALGPSCDAAPDPVACEKLRALVHIALGEAFEARSAFDRLLARDPEARLGPEVSPKVQAMFADARNAMTDVLAMRLAAPVRTNGRLLLEVPNPPAGTVEALGAVVAPEGSTDYRMVPLELRGEVWSGSVEGGNLGSSFRYFLAVSLVGQVQLLVGSEEVPFIARVDSGRGRGHDHDHDHGHDHDHDHGHDDGGDRDDPDDQGSLGPWLEEPSLLGLPRWGVIAIGSGAAAVVLGVVIGSVAAASGGATGDLKINIEVVP